MSEPVIPPPPTGGAVSENRSMMTVLAYLWILFLVPLLVEKDDREVQWHAKHGFVLSVVELVLQLIAVVLGTVTSFTCVGPFIFMLMNAAIFVVFLIIRIVCIMKGTNGERYQVPMLTQYVEKF